MKLTFQLDTEDLGADDIGLIELVYKYQKKQLSSPPPGRVEETDPEVLRFSPFVYAQQN